MESEALSGYLRYNLHGVFGIAVAFMNACVGAVVLLSNPKADLNRSFSFLTVTTTTWIGSFGMASLVTRSTDAFPWMSAAYVVGVPFIAPAFLNLSFALRGMKRPRLVYLIFIWSAVPAVLMVLHPEAIFGFNHFSWGRYPYYLSTFSARLYLVPFLTVFYGASLWMFGNLYQAAKQSPSRFEKRNFKILFVAVLLAYTGSIDFIAAFGVPVYPFGFISLSIFVFLIAYLIVRHQFLSINVLIRRFTAITLIYAFLFGLMLPVVASLFRGTTEHLPFQTVLILIFVSALLGGIFSMGPVIYASLLRHSFWLRGRASMGLAHEIRSPLAAIRSAHDIIRESLREPKGLERIETYLPLVERNIDRLDQLTSDLLAFAKVRSGEVLIESDHVSLDAVAEQVVQFHGMSAEKKGLTIRIQTTKVDVTGDRDKLSQVLSNLISNAIRYSSKGEIVIQIEQQTDYALCSVSDEGVGVPPKDLEKIFSGRYIGSKKSRGSGIGLSIAKAWVEAHGGRIWAESAGAETGTRVTFTVPMA